MRQVDAGAPRFRRFGASLTQAPPSGAPLSGRDALVIAEPTRTWLLRGGLFVLVLAAHLAVLAWLGLRMPLTSFATFEDPPVVEVFFMPPPPPPPDRAPRNRAVRLPTMLRPHVALPPPPSAVALPDPLPTAPAPPSTPQTADGPSEQSRAALRDTLHRTLLNCLDRTKLSAEDRLACEQKMARASSGPPLPLGIDPAKMKRFDDAASAQRDWRAYKDCNSQESCALLYPGLRAAAKRATGAQ